HRRSLRGRDRAARHHRAAGPGAPGGGSQHHRERRGDRAGHIAGWFGGGGERGGARVVPSPKRGRFIRGGVFVTAPATQTQLEARKQPLTEKRMSFSSESVTEGHPDKVADQISDAILDTILAQDPTGRVACETLVTTGMALVAGEITTKCYVDIPKVVRETIR